MSKHILTNASVSNLATTLAARIHLLLPEATKAFAIPRGGVPAALAVAGHHGNLQLVDDPAEADLFIDDIIDSGDTMQRWCDKYPGKPFFALIDKTEEDGEFRDRWVVFPWEETAEGSIEDNIKRLLQFIGEDPERGGLLETPRRVAKAWSYWCSGYGKNVADILKVFEDGAEKCDEMVIVKDIPIYSKCEHHLADIFGTATIAYIPNGKIVGLSKLSRLADMFARRLQVQERLTNQIADALEEHLQPKGVGVIIRARHLCMESRGICQHGHHTITSALRGVLKDKPEARAEFMELAK
jgi:GTP cyclohydrolase I